MPVVQGDTFVQPDKNEKREPAHPYSSALAINYLRWISYCWPLFHAGLVESLTSGAKVFLQCALLSHTGETKSIMISRDYEK